MEVKDVKNAADVITADTNIIEAVQAHPEIMQVFADYGSARAVEVHGRNIGRIVRNEEVAVNRW